MISFSICIKHKFPQLHNTSVRFILFLYSLLSNLENYPFKWSQFFEEKAEIFDIYTKDIEKTKTLIESKRKRNEKKFL